MIISTTAIRRPVFTATLIAAAVVFGLVAFRDLGVDLTPKVEFPVITIVTVLPGADPETMEQRVTDPIEAAINTLSGIKELRSTSADSVSQVVVQFELEKKVDVAFEEVRARLGTIRSTLPTDVRDPVVEKFDIDSQPILTVLVSGDLSPRELSRLADKVVKERLQRVRDVGAVKLVGNRERKIWLWLDPLLLKKHGLTIRDVRLALQREHVEIPGGRLETGKLELVTRTKAEFQSAEELDELILARRGAGTVRLRDVGRAEDGLEEERSYAQLDARPSIALEVRRQSGTNIVAVARAVKEEVARLKEELKPLGLRLEIAVDISTFIERSVRDVEHHLIEGGIIAVFVVLLFLLNFRSTFISALVLPTSVIATFMIMGFMGFTLNVITLMALSLAIGLLIDDAIVVQENIMRHVQAGKPARYAAEFATSEIGLAVLACTLSVVAVFLPTTITKGIVGRFIFPFGLTIAFAVMLSMLVSFTLDPMLSSRLLRKQERLNPFFRALESAFKAVEHFYAALLGIALRHRLAVLAVALLFFGATFFLARNLRQEFQPTEDQGEFMILVRAPLGAPLDRTRALMDEVRERLALGLAPGELEYTYYSIGATELQKVNEGRMYVKLADRGLRSRHQLALMEAARMALKQVQGAKISVQQVPRGGGSAFRGEQVQFEIRGPDFAVLSDLADRYQEKMNKAGYYKDLDTDFETGKPELDVLVDRERAAELGVSPLDVADTVRSAIGGAEVGKFRSGGDRYDIAVRYLEQYRNRPEVIEDLWVPTARGGSVELRNVAKSVKTEIPVEIHRYNRQRVITVLANLEKDKVIGDADKDFTAWDKEIRRPLGYTAELAGFAKIMKESFGYLFETMFLSIIVIYLVLAAQFESLVHPFTIMLSLPLAFVGALGALVALNMTMSILTMMAFIFLLGLVTKNAILLIDYTNTLRERDGVPRDDALRRAGPVRLRPILMTTFAMIGGMLPPALGGSEWRQPMAVAIIGGLVTSTLLTLVVVPVVYSLVDPVSEWMKVKFLKPEWHKPKA